MNGCGAELIDLQLEQDVGVRTKARSECGRRRRRIQPMPTGLLRRTRPTAMQGGCVAQAPARQDANIRHFPEIDRVFFDAGERHGPAAIFYKPLAPICHDLDQQPSRRPPKTLRSGRPLRVTSRLRLAEPHAGQAAGKIRVGGRGSALCSSGLRSPRARRDSRAARIPTDAAAILRMRSNARMSNSVSSGRRRCVATRSAYPRSGNIAAKPGCLDRLTDRCDIAACCRRSNRFAASRASRSFRFC